MNKLTDEELYKLAKRRVYAKKAFNIHLFTYLIISFILIALSIYTKSNWCIFPILGWGIGVFIHKISLVLFLNSKNDIENEFISLKNQKM